MRYLQNLDLEYVVLPDEDNLYDNVDLMQSDCVAAQYWQKNGYPGNPDICALPRPASVEEMKNQNSIPIVGYDAGHIREMPVYDRKRSLFSIKKLRYPFPFHSQIESYLSMALVSSYSARRQGVTELSREICVSGEQSESRILSCMDAVSANVLGFSIVGTSGTGKSTAFDLACKKYPRAIRHNFAAGSYVQIPIVRLTAFANSNLSALFLSFARQLDKILDTGQDHLVMLQSKSNLGRITAIICDWIELYHIGVVAIDEIQFLDFTAGSAKSFENLLTVTANTGAALVAIGTPEACRAWSGMLRIQRRVGSAIVRADSYCKDKKYMDMIIKKMWKYQWLSEKAELTQEVMDIMYEESLGSIDLLTSLWMMVQFEVLCRKRQPVIDAAFVRAVSQEKFKEMKELLCSELIESERMFLDIRESLLNDISKSAIADEERHISETLLEAAENIAAHYDRDFVMGDIMETIQCCNPEFSEMLIRKAFAKAEKEDGFKAAKKQERVRRIMEILRKSGQRREKSRETAKKSSGKVQMEMLQDALKDHMLA